MIKIVTHGHRAHTLKRVIADRLDPDFVEDLALADPGVRAAAYERIEPLTRRRLRVAVTAYMLAHPDE